VYKYVNRGLFEKDKITFILMMCFKILITAGKINSNDVGLFLKAGAAEDIKSRPKPTGSQFAFISERAWLNIVAFSKHCFNDAPVATFKELPELILKNQPGWQAFFEKNDP
jgi:dynein heavy chain